MHTPAISSDGRVLGILEVSRAFGDGSLKKHGVICLPDIKRCQLTNNDKLDVYYVVNSTATCNLACIYI